jgi:hypothetical protein
VLAVEASSIAHNFAHVSQMLLQFYATKDYKLFTDALAALLQQEPLK